MTDDKTPTTVEIAIIGMAGRFPGAPDVETFWANVRNGVESIRALSEQELLAAGVTRGELDDPDYVRASPVLDDIDKFDAAFFGFSPRDASVMDPAHRLFLETAWKAVENAGYTGLPQEGAVGVFAGSGAPLYMIENLRTNPELMASMGEFLVRHTGNDMNFLATRVSYEMDLRGPSINVQTACSSALVSVHMACQSLALGECAMALAGGATVLTPSGQGYLYKEGEILSPDGHCRPFDAKSAGTVFGSGVGAVVLKRLSDALDDGDTIHAVIKGSAVNNDGAMKVGYLAPGVEGQAAVVGAALSAAGVDADTISYIETHGTGTLIGDPIEVEALNEAFRPRTAKRGYCAIGSVKSNIGHLGEAAAVASLIKVVMALKHRELPPTLGYETPNPAIDFDNSPFFVNDSLRAWEAQGTLRAGITALGAGGTNCHLILEQAPPALPGDSARDQQLIVLSARTKAALDQASDNLAAALEADPDLDLADAAYTLAVGRRPMAHRRALAAADRAEAIARLRAREAKTVVTDEAGEAARGLVFMFPGGGAQYVRMGADLYAADPVYSEALDRCLAIAAPLCGRDLRPLIFASAEQAETATKELERPSLALPALFAAEYAMAQMFQAWGASPEAFIGHSMGEYVAASLSGVMVLEDALKLVCTRGRLFETVQAGAMTSVPMSEADLSALLPVGVSIAAVNAPDLVVASGPVDAIAALEARLAKDEVETTRIRIDVAAHSEMLDPILEQFRAVCRTISLRAPTIPFVSNVTGAWITAAQATDPNYWVSHLRSTVRFAEGLETLLATGDKVLVEIGPGRTLSMLAKAQKTPQKHALNSMRHPQEQASDLAYALTTFGRLWAAGVAVDWHAFYDGQLRNRVPLPTYPFESKSFWVAPGAAAPSASATELRKREDIGDWFYSVGFAEKPLIRRPSDAAPPRWLIVSETLQDTRDLEMALGPDVVSVGLAGARFAPDGPGRWRFDLDAPDQYVELLRALESEGRLPQHVVFIADQRGVASADEAISRHFMHPVWLAQALGELEGPIQLSSITSGLAGLGEQAIDPAHALILGPMLVAPREFTQLSARCIDLPLGPLAGERGKRLNQQLVDELRAQSPDRLVALRPGVRLTQQISPLPLMTPPAEGAASRLWLREGGTYLVTGGLGGIGLQIARYLASAKSVKLALLSRQGLPPENEWDALVARLPSSLAASRIRQVRELRDLGAEVLVVDGDVGDRASLDAALRKVRTALGPLNGVIHAAGVLDDAPMLAKTPESMLSVLRPKVIGALALDSLVTEPLDLFVVFSSVTSFLGLPGQVDYAAANAFLDAFARERAQRAPGRTLAINWNAWRDVGMAAESYRAQAHPSSITNDADHPILDGYRDEANQRVFESQLSADRHWLLDEHRIKGGSALLPGTAFVEILRAAFAQGRKPGAIELFDLSFLRPFNVGDGETRRMSVSVVSEGEISDITISADEAEDPVALGRARAFSGPAPTPLDLAAIAARCSESEVAPLDRFLPQDFVTFGPRWANIVRTRYGVGEALGEHVLDDRFVAELDHYGLHPAMLDMATGGAQALIPGVDLAKDFFVPLGYGAVRVFARMPARVFSHVRCLPDTKGGDLAYFDVTLAGPDGRVFADISRFTMKRIDASSSLMSPPERRSRRDSVRNNALEVLLREAIAPAEGVEAFDRIMAQSAVVQAVASSVDVNLWLRQLTAEAAGPSLTTTTGSFDRPELASDYAVPSSEVEEVLAGLWSELLGVRVVGVHDDFFELGGNSLVAVRMLAAIRKKFLVSLPLATLFDTPTIAELAARLAAHGVNTESIKPEAGQLP